MSLSLLGAVYLGTDWTPATPLADVRAGKADIRKGMKGEPVRYVQQRVGLTGSDADGMFGDATFEAVKKFQRSMEMEDDGFVGPQTLAALDGVYIVPEKASAPSKGSSAAPPPPQLSTGMKAAAVGGMIAAPLLIGGVSLAVLALIFAAFGGEKR